MEKDEFQEAFEAVETAKQINDEIKKVKGSERVAAAAAAKKVALEKYENSVVKCDDEGVEINPEDTDQDLE
jgi:hypothetical protein